MKKAVIIFILLFLGYWLWTRSGSESRKTSTFPPTTADVEIAQLFTDYDKISASITVDGKPDDWAEIPVLIEDVVGDTRPPDFKSLKMAMDDNTIYFLVEIVGWSEGEGFKKVPVTIGPMKGPGTFQGVCGKIYLDVDNLQITGRRVGDIFKRHDNEMYGAEYKVDLPICFYGFEGPQVDFWLKHWSEMGGEYIDVDTGPRTVAYGDTFMEFSFPAALLAGSGKGHMLSVIYDDSSGLKEYGIARRVALPFLVNKSESE